MGSSNPTWRALVLSGGGAKGEFQIGALECLRDRTDWEFEFFTGVSVGALNVAILAQHDRLSDGLSKLTVVWDSIRGNRDVYTGGSIALGALLSLFTRSRLARDSIFNSAPIARLIDRHVQWSEMKHGFSVGVTSLTDGMPYTVTNLQSVLDAKPRNGRTLSLNLETGRPGSIPDEISAFILASASMPLLFPPVEIYGHKFVDGGVRDVTPLSAAFDAAKAARDEGWYGDMEILIISTAPAILPLNGGKHLDSGREIIGRALEIMIHEILSNDVALASTLNELAYAQRRFIQVPVRHVRPDEDLELGTLDFKDLEGRRRVRRLGYTAMEKQLEADQMAA
jgi:NTE family protein